MNIARTPPAVASRHHAGTGGQRKISGKLFGYARVSVASYADANNLENQRRVLDDCEQVFKDVGSGASWNRPGLNRLKVALQPGDCVKVAALDRLGRSLTEVLELPGWLRENGVDIISLRESIDQDSAMGRAMLHVAIVLAEMERDLARERTLAGLERIKATGKRVVQRKGASWRHAEEIQDMRQRDDLSWGRMATMTGLPSSSIRRICTWDLEEIVPTAFRGRITGTSGRRGNCVEQCYLPDNGCGYHLKNDVAAMAWLISGCWSTIG